MYTLECYALGHINKGQHWMSKQFCCTSTHLLEVNLLKGYIVKGDSKVMIILCESCSRVEAQLSQPTGFD